MLKMVNHLQLNPLNRDSIVPLHRQLLDQIREAVLGKDFNPKEPLCKEVEIAERLDISRSVVRQAILQLVNEGFLYRIPGKGTFLATPIMEYDILGFYNFKKEVERQGQVLSLGLVLYERTPMDPISAGLFRTKEEGYKVTVWRVLYVNKVPVIMERTIIPESLIPGISEDDVRDTPFLSLFKRCGIMISKAKKYIEPRLADSFISKELGIKTGTPVLVIDRYTYGQDDETVIARCEWTVRGDRCRNYISLEATIL